MILIVVIIPILLFTTLIVIVYWNQDAIIQEIVKNANKDFEGHIELDGSHVAPFANFPYISIDIEGLKVFENKDITQNPVIDLGDTYIGFDFWTLISGQFEIKSIKIANGDINIVEYNDGELNITNAFQTTKEVEVDKIEEEFHLNLSDIYLDNVEINKINMDSLEFDAYFNKADVGFKTVKDHLYFSIKSDFKLCMIEKGDTSFIKSKQFITDAKFDYFKAKDSIVISPSSITVEKSLFEFEGGIDVLDDFNLDLKFSGQKPDFSLLISLAPDELIPVLKAFENRGDVYFAASVKGKSILGHVPYVEAKFGCKEGYFKNPETDKVLDDLSFEGFFTNGENRTLESMRFELKDFNARPETGRFKVNLIVENFNSPDVDLEVTTLFDLDYLAKFLNVEDLRNLSGKVELIMNFHDIIDLNNPEKAIEQMNEAYFTRLSVRNLGFDIPGYNERIENINVSLNVDGHRAELENFSMKVGGSDIAINGSVSDLPAIIHHTNKEVESRLSIHADALDVNELTLARGEEGVEEYIRNLDLNFNFISSAKALTEAPHLPYGSFSIENFTADLTNYPHTLHDFTASIRIDTNDIDIFDFSGMIDKSDVHFIGKVEKYPFWFQEKLEGDSKIEFDLSAQLLQLKDIFSYGGENYVPEDYRDEEFRDLKIHGNTALHFVNEGLQSADIYITEVKGKMNIHPMKLEKFGGRVHIENDHLSLEKFRGKIGNTSFESNLEYYFGEDEKNRKKENLLDFRASRLDFDQLFDYQAPEKGETVEHDSVFSIFDIPFPDMSFSLQIGKMNYHKYLLKNINATLKTTKNHRLDIDTLSMDIAGGQLAINGYFNGENRAEIYFFPTIKMKNIDLDKVMFKFDNFGQDEVVSDNLHGRISGKLWGKIHTHADLIPIIEDSDIYMDVEVTGGSIENYGPLEALAGYFEDKSLHKVIFDTLANHIDLKKGEMVIPEMIINTNLGFIVVSGKQDMNMNMEYYLRVPLKMVTSAGSRKLFGKKEEKDPEELFDYDKNKKYRFINIKITGDAEDYKISLGKKKEKNS